MNLLGHPFSKNANQKLPGRTIFGHIVGYLVRARISASDKDLPVPVGILIRLSR